MKSIAKLAAAMVILAGSATSALAATGIREDNSGIVVWAFLGLCGLIVMAQLVPAILVLFGIVKGVASEKQELAEEKVQ
ncbi:hypothetical protein DESUT3_18530 [Desulfuromonas versatilis]|uniref:Uncharacterized protein n=1 Tax=Desulfuromonas versatilis TaxID=2802975 RepID=A0ABN6DXZ0_9BACT|nr:hypothetical protein [Desulfuromonas versatilis]BCR04784.1 hypothetical protein DESUT3_18530 [Desulfuromonas versatilis]